MNKYKIILISLLMVGFLLRTINISENIQPIYGDELTIAYDSYSILKTGRDQTGQLFPVTFKMRLNSPGGYIYFSIPFVAIFGPTALGVRMLSVLSGLGIIFLLYLISKNYFGEKVGISAAAITTFMPWDILLSRIGFETHFALFLSLLGWYFLILAKRKPLFYAVSALSFGLTMHTYQAFKLITPLFLPLLIWHQASFKNVSTFKDKLFFSIAVLIMALFLGLFGLQALTAKSEERFSTINIFAREELREQIQQKINLERSIIMLPGYISKYFHNKQIEYAKLILENYLQNFSLDFLVIHGDRNPRHNLSTMGQIYLVQLILFLIGLVLSWQKERKILTFLLLWLILAPIPAAVVDQPHALRSIFMIPPLVIISALGLANLINRKSKIFLILILAGFLIQFTFFIQKLFFLSPFEYGRFLSYPAKLASEITLQNRNNFKYIILSDRIDDIEFAYPVYGKINPVEVINQNKMRDKLGKYQFKRLGNVYIGNIPDHEIEGFINNLDGPVLFLGHVEQKKSLSNFRTISGTDNLGALIMVKKEAY